jgi:hypothetical protein
MSVLPATAAGEGPLARPLFTAVYGEAKHISAPQEKQGTPEKNGVPLKRHAAGRGY